MGELAGWERPNWFASSAQPREYKYSYGKQNWFDNCRDECLAVRDTVAIFDQTCYPVFLVKGQDALAVLNLISANNIDIAINRIVYTQWLNERGGIEADVTITRLSVNEFMVVSSCANENRDFYWLQQHIAPDMNVVASNFSSGYAMFGVMGPGSRALLQSLTSTNIDNESLPFYSSLEIDIGYARIRANRLTYVGELGYELYIPVEFAQHVYERLCAAGKQFGLKHAGFHALNACRMEKSYKHYGHDIGDELDPLSAGLSFAVDMGKAHFIGQTALTKIEKPLKKRLVNIAIRDDDPPLMLHDEPIYLGKEMIGLTTSAMWGHRVNRSLAIALFTHPEGINAKLLTDNEFTIEVAKTRYPIDVQLAPFYDPKSLRVKG